VRFPGPQSPCKGFLFRIARPFDRRLLQAWGPFSALSDHMDRSYLSPISTCLFPFPHYTTFVMASSRKSSIEELGKKIGMDLPLSKQQFTKIIRDIHLETANLPYPKCYAIKKVPGQTRSAAYAVYIIKFFSRNNGASVHSAQYFRAISTPTTIDDLIPSGQEISVNDFFEKVDQEFFAICLGNA